MIDFGGLKKSEVAIFECLNVIDEMQNVSVGAKFLANHILRQSEAWEVSWDYYAKLFNKSVKTIKSWRDELSNAGVWLVTNKNDIIFNNVVSKIDNLEKNDNFGKNSLIWKKTPILEKNDNFGKNFDKKEKNLLNLNFIKNKPTPAGVRACDTSIGEFSKPTETLENPHFERDFSKNVALSSQDLDNFADDLSENQREFDKTSELQCAGSENLTQINFYNEGEAKQNETKAQGTAQNSTAVALGLQKIAFISTQKAPQMSISEAFARYQDKNFSVCGGENLTQINFYESGEARQNAQQNERDFTHGETKAQVDISKMEKATQNAEQTQNEALNATTAQNRKERQAKKAQKSPENVAAELFDKNAEFAAQANFSEGEKSAVLDYFAYKAEHKRHPLTERVAKATLKQCIKIKAQNKDLIDIIERTIANNWADLRWLADKPKNAWQAQQDERKAKDDEILARYLKRKNAAQKAV